MYALGKNTPPYALFGRDMRFRVGCTFHDRRGPAALIVNLNSRSPDDIRIDTVRAALKGTGWNCFPWSCEVPKNGRDRWRFFGVVHRGDLPESDFRRISV